MSNDRDLILLRIADALDRIAPAPPKPQTVNADHPAWHWDGAAIHAIAHFAPLALDLLTGVEAQKLAVLENTRRLASGTAAHDVLLWGARGMGKSALVKSAVDAVRSEGSSLILIELMSDHLDTLPHLFALLTDSNIPAVVFIDDISFDDASPAPRILRSMLEGGASARPDHVRIYATSNRRHIVARSLQEQDDPVNPRDVIDDRLALSDRFGLRLGFHTATQDDYLAMIRSYCAAHALPFDETDALLWSNQRGGRSGRVAWQYLVERLGRAGRRV
jgi:hypothetical protein